MCITVPPRSERSDEKDQAEAEGASGHEELLLSEYLLEIVVAEAHVLFHPHGAGECQVRSRGPASHVSRDDPLVVPVEQHRKWHDHQQEEHHGHDGDVVLGETGRLAID